MISDPVVAAERTRALIDELLSLPAETERVEFKGNDADPPTIGKLVSALSNSARLADRPFAYVLWGVRDSDREAVGTTFEPSSRKHQGQPLEFWLAQRLRPGVDLSFETIERENARLVLLTIPAAPSSPVEFDRSAYIRIGSATPRLSEHPERLRTLWAKLQPYAWESGLAAQFLPGDDVLSLLDYAGYFDLTGQPLPDNRQGIFEKLEADRLVQREVGDRWNVTNLGAILFARRLSDFSPPLSRKAVRFAAYGGSSRTDPVTRRRDGQRGYATGFQELVDYIDGLLPRNEYIGRAFREERPLYPPVAIRELIANALIHQDMTVTGAGPLIELFQDRLEITNPGRSLVEAERFLDLPPRSRNEALASLMRRMGLCEEQGTGIDKVIGSVEFHQLPPPDFRTEETAVRAVLYAPRRFADMTPDERVRACYQHAALKYVSGERMTNATLRGRFGIDSRNSAQVSTVIRRALEAGLLRAGDSAHPRRGYVPFWA